MCVYQFKTNIWVILNVPELTRELTAFNQHFLQRSRRAKRFAGYLCLNFCRIGTVPIVGSELTWIKDRRHICQASMLVS